MRVILGVGKRLRATQTPYRKPSPFGSAWRPEGLSRGPLRGPSAPQAGAALQKTREPPEVVLSEVGKNESIQTEGDPGVHPDA